MSSPPPVDTLTSHLPWFHLRALAARSQPPAIPVVRATAGAVLFVDVTGFSRLTEDLARAGIGGAEQLAGILTDYFGRLTDLITAHGGDVLSFAGDAALALWFEDDHPLPEAACLAAQTGLAIQQTLSAYQATPEVVLQQRVSVGVGRLYVTELGGLADRRQLFVPGGAIADAGVINDHAAPGQVVASAAVWSLIETRCSGVANQMGSVTLGEVQVPVVPMPLTRPAVPPAHIGQVRSFVHNVVQHRLVAGDDQWLAEFRNLSLLFIGLGVVDLEAAGIFDRLQAAMTVVQRSVQHYEGTLHRVHMADKGITLVVAFGLPPLTHENDAARAVRAALDLAEALKAAGFPPSIGVTTGRAFCGACGGAERRQYSIYGTVINRAARLMQKADGGVLCDPETVAAVKPDAHLSFEGGAPVPLKGFADPVILYTPRFQKRQVDASRVPTEVVGRTEEVGHIDRALAALKSTGTGGVIVLEGEAGIGKSHLLAHALQQAAAAGLTTLTAQADEIEKDSPLYAFRRVFRTIFGLEGRTEAAKSSGSYFTDRLNQWAALETWAPLLNGVLGLNLPENDLTRAMSEEARAERVQEMLVSVLKDHIAREGPAVLAVEDAHWIDSASWTLLGNCAALEGLLLMGSTRPLDPPPDPLVALLERPGTAHFTLAALSGADVLHLVCRRLQVAALPDAVGELIQQRAAGHPLFSEELAYLLRDTGFINIQDGVCRLAAGEALPAQKLAALVDALDLPGSVQGVINRRLDRLPQDQLLTLKVASILGQQFAPEAVQDVHPVATAQVEADLVALQLRKIVEPDAEGGYRFRHAITQEVAYNTMLFAQRRGLHEAAAAWHEATYADELDRHYPVLAHHWQRAEVYPKAVGYLAQAGAQALDGFANQEAVHFLHEAVALSEKLDPGEAAQFTPLERAAWELRLGRAYVNWSKYSEARAHFEKGLAVYDRSPPEGFKAIPMLLGQLMRQGMHRVWARRFVGANAHAQDQLQEAARAYIGLFEIYFQDGDAGKGLYAIVRSLNVAELAGPSKELAHGYALMGSTVGTMGLRKWAAGYEQKAKGLLQGIEAPSTEAWTAMAFGAYQAGLGAWEEARQRFETTIALSERLNDRRRWEDGTYHLSVVHFLEGDFSTSLTMARAMYRSTRKGADGRGRADALWRIMLGLLHMDHREPIPALLDELAALQVGVAPLKDLLLYTRRAELHFRERRYQDARENLDLACDQLLSIAPLYYEVLSEYTAIARLYADCIERATQNPALNGDPDALAKRFQKVKRALAGYARLFPIGRPALALYNGLAFWHADRPAKAHKAWHKSLALAQALKMPYEEARAHYEIGRHLAASDPERDTHLNRACTVFEHLGARYDLQLAQHERQAHV